jgi:hypothetical protein
LTQPAASHRHEEGVYRSVAQPEDGGRRSSAVRLLTDRTFALRAIRYALGLPTPMATEDRRVLEQVIFRHYAARADIRSILFVGCQWYTRHYGRTFFATRDYWTIEPDEKARKYGAPRHVVAPLERLDAFFPEGYFDLIVCNGVYGFGLDTLEQCETALGHCHSRLREGGELVFGWNDVPARTPVPLTSLRSLARFRKVPFPAFGSWRYLTDTPYRHIYDFYCR